MDSRFTGKKVKRQAKEPGEMDGEDQNKTQEEDDRKESDSTYEDRVTEGLMGIMEDSEET